MCGCTDWSGVTLFASVSRDTSYLTLATRQSHPDITGCQSAHPCHLDMSYTIRYRTHVVNVLGDSVAPGQSRRLRMLIWSYIVHTCLSAPFKYNTILDVKSIYSRVLSAGKYLLTKHNGLSLLNLKLILKVDTAPAVSELWTGRQYLPDMLLVLSQWYVFSRVGWHQRATDLIDPEFIFCY